MSYYYPFFHTRPEKPYNGYSIIGTKDPVLDKMLEDVAGETSFIKRRAKFKQVVLYVREKVLLLPYVSPIHVTVWSDKLKNIEPLEHFQVERSFMNAWLDT